MTRRARLQRITKGLICRVHHLAPDKLGLSSKRCVQLNERAKEMKSMEIYPKHLMKGVVSIVCERKERAADAPWLCRVALVHSASLMRASRRTFAWLQLAAAVGGVLLQAGGLWPEGAACVPSWSVSLSPLIAMHPSSTQRLNYFQQHHGDCDVI